MNRQYTVPHSLMTTRPGIATSSSWPDLKYTRNDRNQPMLPPLEDLCTPNRAPLAKIPYRAPTNSEQNEPLPSICELVPELPASCSSSFSPISRCEENYKFQGARTYHNFNSSSTLDLSPQSMLKRRKLYTEEDEEGRTLREEIIHKLPDIYSQTEQSNRFPQTGQFNSDASLSPRRSSTYSTADTRRKSPQKNLYASTANPNRNSPLPFQRARRSTSEPQQLAGPASPRCSDALSRSTSELQNYAEKGFHRIENLSISESQTVRQSEASPCTPKYSIPHLLRPGIMENEYSFEPPRDVSNERNYYSNKLSFHPTAPNAPTFRPRTEQVSYHPHMTSNYNDYESSRCNTHLGPAAFSVHSAQKISGVHPHQAPARENSVISSTTSHGTSSDRHDNYAHDNGNSPGNESKSRKRRGNLPKETTDKLRAWFVSHLAHPYPTEDEKQQLMDETGLQMNQISNWYINARRRQLPAMAANARAEAEARRISQRNMNDQCIDIVERTSMDHERFDPSHLSGGNVETQI